MLHYSLPLIPPFHHTVGGDHMVLKAEEATQVMSFRSGEAREPGRVGGYLAYCAWETFTHPTLLVALLGLTWHCKKGGIAFTNLQYQSQGRFHQPGTVYYALPQAAFQKILGVLFCVHSHEFYR